jgi:hypothetical protein
VTKTFRSVPYSYPDGHLLLRSKDFVSVSRAPIRRDERGRARKSWLHPLRSWSLRQNPGRFKALNHRGFATLLFDLLTPQEEIDRSNVFDVVMPGERLISAVDRLQSQDPAIASLPVGLFGASTGAAAALIAAAQLPDRIAAVVSRGGRPELAEDALAHLRGPRALEITPGAMHLFPEPGAMDLSTTPLCGSSDICRRQGQSVPRARWEQ